jgi:diguanylate cyclase (GGDEF)-like protein
MVPTGGSRAKGQALWDESGKPTRLAGSISDISELKKSEEAIRNLAESDPLTALPNRRAFHERLAVALEHAQRAGRRVGIMLLDLDNFKSVNDAFGHPLGDALLREAGNRIVKCVREADTVARLGGDEFVVVVPNLERRRDIDCLANIASSSQNRSIWGKSHGGEYRSRSIRKTPRMRRIYSHADSLYQAKQLGGGGIVSEGTGCAYAGAQRWRPICARRLPGASSSCTTSRSLI